MYFGNSQFIMQNIFHYNLFVHNFSTYRDQRYYGSYLLLSILYFPHCMQDINKTMLANYMCLINTSHYSICLYFFISFQLCIIVEEVINNNFMFELLK